MANYDQAKLISRCRHKSDYCIYCMRTGWEDELHGKPFAAPGWEQLQVHGKSKYGLITVFNILLRVHLRAMGFHRAIYFLSFKKVGWIQSRYHDQQYKSVHTSFSFTTSHSALLNPAHIFRLYSSTHHSPGFSWYSSSSRTHMLHSTQHSPRSDQGSSHMITHQTLHLFFSICITQAEAQAPFRPAQDHMRLCP